MINAPQRRRAARLSGRVRLVYALGLLLCGAFAAAASEGPGEARLNAFLQAFETLEARFEQRVIDERGQLVEEAEGTVALSRPGRFRWDYETPYRQRIVADGEWVWIYDLELEQVTRKSMDQALGSTPALILDSRAAVDAHYAIRELGEREGLLWVALQPLDGEVEYEAVRLGFDSAGLSRMELEDSFGQTTRLRLYDQRLDVALEPERFVFRPPPGVDVFDAGAPEAAAP